MHGDEIDSERTVGQLVRLGDLGVEQGRCHRLAQNGGLAVGRSGSAPHKMREFGEAGHRERFVAVASDDH